MTTLRTITGQFQHVTGEVLPNTTITFVPVAMLAGDGDDVAILGDAFEVTSDGSGLVNFDAYEGDYTVEYTTSRGKVTRAARVPNDAPWTMGRFLAPTGTYTPSLVQQALDARDESEASATAAAAFAAEAEATAETLGDLAELEALVARSEDAEAATVAAKNTAFDNLNVYASLPDLIAASLANGARPKVWTTTEEIDNYVITGGVPVWVSKDDQQNALALAAQALYPFPVQPSVEVEPLRALGWGGRGLPGLSDMATSLYPWCSGQMPAAASFAGTITNRFVAGAGAGLAQRVQFTATTQTFYFFLNRTLESGDWTASIRLRSTAGAGNQTVRFGELADATDIAITEGVWVTATRTLVGGTTRSLTLRGDTTNTPDVLVDEVRVHRADGSASLALNFGGGSIQRDFGLINSHDFVRPGYIDCNTAGGILKAPTFPAVSTWAEWTFMVAFRKNGAPGADMTLLSTVLDAGLGTTANTFKITIDGPGGELIMSPVTQVGGAASPKYCNNDWHIVAVTARAGEVRNWHYGVQTRSGTTASPGFSWTFLRALGNTESSLAFDGDLGGVWAWNKALTADELPAAFGAAEARLRAKGLNTERGRIAYIAEGDSRTATFSGVTSPSYAFCMFDATVTGGVQQFGGVQGTSGDGIDEVEGDVPEVVRSIRGAVACGRVPVVSLLIGVNDNSSIIADPAAYAARIEAVLQQYKDAGAKVVACTELPIGAAAGGGTGSAWETGRAALRTLLLASTVPDAVADLGDPSTVMGDPDSPDNEPTLWDDDLHPLAAGHALLAPVLWTAIQAAVSA